MPQYAQYPASGNGAVGDNVVITGPLGQAAMAASIPVVIASDQTPVPVSAGSGNLATGTISGTGQIFIQNCSTFNSVSVSFATLGAGNVVQFQVSNDQVVWQPFALISSDGSVISTTATTQGIWKGAVNAPFFRLFCTTYVGPAIAATAYFKYEAGPSNAILALQQGTWNINAAQAGSWAVAATQSGSWAIAATQSGTWAIRLQDGSGTALTSQTVGSKQGLDTNILGYTLSQTVTLNYASTNVTTSAFTQLISSTSNVYQLWDIYDNSGSIMEIAFGASGSEVVKFSVPKGGQGLVRLEVPASTRISIKAVSANATTDYLVINLYG